MIRFENLSKTFGSKPLFSGLSYHFPEGERIALFGGNGEGKTTLLNIIMGLEEPDSGSVLRPKSAHVACLPQSPNPHPEKNLFDECLAGHRALWSLRKEMSEFLRKMEIAFVETDFEVYEEKRIQYEQQDGYNLEGEAVKILKGLGFSEERWKEHPETLSGGWRMRLELARLLVSKPDFLILDEPTNHLDLPAIEWLEETLEAFRGTILFVTHDQALLESLPTLILELQKGQLTPYSGNYTTYKTQKTLKEALTKVTLKKLTREREHKQKFIDRFGAKATKAAQANSRKKAIEKIDSALAALPEDQENATLRFPKLIYPTSARHVLTLETASIGYERALLKNLFFSLERGEKYAIVGPNGLGKSTLLKTLVGELPLLKGKMIWGDPVVVGFFRQDAAEHLQTSETVWTVAQSHAPHLPPTQLRSLLGSFLFSGDSVDKPTRVLSGGERSRLALCLLLARRPNCLLLDEPTNHLDLSSKAVLAHALKLYPGSLLLVSHDRAFMETVADRLWDLQPKD